MKIRTSFVSNSSSSSFCLYGVFIDEYKLTKLCPKEENNDDEDFDIRIAAEKLCKNTDLTYINVDNDGCYFGLSPYELLDNETGKQFKGRVKAEISKILGSETECNWHTEVIYD